MRLLGNLFCDPFRQGRCASSNSLFLGVLLWLATITPVWAGAVSVNTSLSEQGVWDSNPLLLSHDAKAIYGSVTTPKVTITDKTPLSSLELNGWVNQNLYNDRDYDTTDFHGNMTLGRQNQRWNASLGSAVDYDTIRQSDWSTLGISNKNARELLYNFKPSLTYTPNPTTSLTTDLGYARAAFQGIGNRNYDIISASQSVQKAFTPLHTGFLTLQADKYRTVDNLPASKTISVGPSIGWMTKLSPKLTASLSGGGQYSRQEGYLVSTNAWQLHAIFMGSLVFKGEQDTINFTSQRAKQPFNNGSQYYMTSFNLSETRQITELFTVNMGAGYQFADYADYVGNTFDYRYNGNVGMQYNATQALTLSARYRYRFDSWTGGLQARENMGLLGVNYHYQM